MKIKIDKKLKAEGKVPVSASTLQKAAARLLDQGAIVTAEIDYIRKTLGASATQSDIDAQVIAVRKMPWATFATLE